MQLFSSLFIFPFQVFAKMCRGRDMELLPYVLSTVLHVIAPSEDACLEMCDYEVN